MYRKAVGIVGSDGYLHLSAVRDLVASLGACGNPPQIVTRNHGSVDRAVAADARRCGLEPDVIRTRREPDHQLVARCDAIVAFWDGRSQGTRHIIALARASGIPVAVHGLVA